VTEARVWTLTIPQPCSWLSANDRLHWARESSLVRHWRDAALQWARFEKLPKNLARVRLDAVLHFTTNRRRDTATNYHLTLKAIGDGLAYGPKPPHGYGLIVDDDDAHLDGPHITIGAKVERVGRVVLTITEVQ
jgi:hypothetical protein